MRERAVEVLAGQEAWVVGGAVRDALLGRPVLDLDIACAAPEQAARAYARDLDAAPFPLSERHGAWRVALADGRTVDFTPLPHGIETDLATRDFTINAIAEPLAGGELVDPTGGGVDLELRTLRAVSETVFEDDPLRLLRAVRLEDELGFRLAPLTEELVRRHAPLVDRPAGERVLAELHRLSASGFRRLDELGLLAPLGGALDERLERLDEPEFRLVAVFRERLEALPVSNETR
ncbi:MAG: tRNA nucleotidyltransferase, partial [Gaiellaceae bacterium]